MSLVLLLTAALAGGAWLLTGGRYYQVRVTDRSARTQPLAVMLISRDLRLSVERLEGSVRSQSGRNGYSVFFESVADTDDGYWPYDPSTIVFNGAGFTLLAVHTPGLMTEWVVSVPLWFLCAVSGAVGLILGRRVALLRRRIRIERGQCLACGYDLRSTPGRCPECGRPAEAR